MKTPILLSSGDSDRKYLEIINLTNSVLESKERLEKDLMTGLDAFVVGQEEAKKEIVRVLIDGLFNEFRDQ